ncbi:DUF6894 family protein [Belnapia moabensis]|uniref:DUF6894 family protein n=1 Tax=Belnapia moabensis TaxID=365533 RepID=UPI0012EDCDD8|nr:hypothetical protein [Belnapia moabensis]
MFLHIDTGFIRIEDTTGRLFKNLDDAKIEAATLISEVAFAWPRDNRPLTNFHVDICNEKGMLVETVPVQNLCQPSAAE